MASIRIQSWVALRVALIVSPVVFVMLRLIGTGGRNLTSGPDGMRMERLLITDMGAPDPSFVSTFSRYASEHPSTSESNAPSTSSTSTGPSPPLRPWSIPSLNPMPSDLIAPPSAIPTLYSSGAPSQPAPPSQITSQFPSLSPSKSVMPSYIPSGSQRPTSNPSFTPTSTPTESIVPSAVPAFYASGAPSHSAVPSQTPSQFPSWIPSLSVVPSYTPSASLRPTLNPSTMPTSTPTQSIAPSAGPTFYPSTMPTSTPTESIAPTFYPSDTPSHSIAPSQIPSHFPSWGPSYSAMPSYSPSESLDPSLSFAPSVMQNQTSFYAIADVPYTKEELVYLTWYLHFYVDANVDFLIHLGDIKRGTKNCTQELLEEMARSLSASSVPVFIIVGDNEFNDCPNISPAVALDLWRGTFARFDKKHWTHDLQVMQMPERPEIFSFLNKRTLLFGLNIVGGLVHDQDEWDQRHADQVEWVTSLMLDHQNDVHSVVLFGHASPGNRKHGAFFNPFTTFLESEFPTNVPVLYLCGDAHSWSYDPEYRGVSNLIRIRLNGGVLEEPMVKVTVDPDGLGQDPTEAFDTERYKLPE